MAQNKKPKSITLPPEMKDHLESLGSDIEKSEASIEVLQRLGMDTKAIEEKLDWAKDVRKTLLSEFTD